MKLRKILSLLLVATLSIGITSCSKDDDKFSTPDSIVGTWKYVKYDIEFKTSNPATDLLIKEYIKKNEFTQDLNFPQTITFKEDKTYSQVFTTHTQTGTYTYSTGKLTITPSGVASFPAVDVTSSGGTLKFTSDAKSMVIELFGSDLKKFDLVTIFQKQ